MSTSASISSTTSSSRSRRRSPAQRRPSTGTKAVLYLCKKQSAHVLRWRHRDRALDRDVRNRPATFVWAVGREGLAGRTRTQGRLCSVTATYRSSLSVCARPILSTTARPELTRPKMVCLPVRPVFLRAPTVSFRDELQGQTLARAERAKNGTVQVRCRCERDEELAAVRVGPTVGHGQDPGAGVLELGGDLVLKLFAARCNASMSACAWKTS